MENKQFQRIKEEFGGADVQKKIEMYVNTEGLSQVQYRELLTMFPLSELHRLEEAMK